MNVCAGADSGPLRDSDKARYIIFLKNLLKLLRKSVPSEYFHTFS
jgi:hypothetical protein